MKKKLETKLLLVLLILSIMPLYRPFVVDSGVTAPPRNPSIPQTQITTSENDLTLT